MATEGDADTLKLYWDHFFKSETGTYEKSTWLDLFLAEFLIQFNEGANANELINFCPVSGVVTLVGCELLCGIHRVTSSINAHYAPPLPSLDAPCSGNEAVTLTQEPTGNEEVEPKTEDTRPVGLFTRANAQSSAEILKKYLLSGVAWKCLVLLKALGVEGLSCCRQLSSVLIWLYGELGGGSSGSVNRHVPRHPSETAIYQLFSHKIWAKQKVNNNQGAKVTSVPSERGFVIGRSRLSSQMKLEPESKTRRKLVKVNPSSDSGDSHDDLQVLNRSLTIKLSTPSDDFDYFDSPLAHRIPNDFSNETLYSDPYNTPRKTKPKAEDYTNNKHREIINSEISTFEFTLIITDLLQELCKAESSLSGSEGSQISVQCINFSLKNLCSLQFGSLPVCSQQYNDYEVSRIKVALTELLIVSLDKVLISSELCAKLINNGILPMLLRILEDVICKSSGKYHAKADYNLAKGNKESNKDEAENVLKFVFGIAYSITAFFHCLLMQCRSVDKLREFTDQFKLYGECLKGGLLRECIELMIRIPGVDQEETITLIKKLIESIGKLVNGMKRVRSEVVHSAACPRSRHKACRQRVAAGMHHHHDILGEASTGLPLSSTCCVSVLYGTLTSLVADEEVSAQTMLRNKILRVMLNCGVCCCFSPGFLMENIVRVMLTHNTTASLCLQVLEHTVYGELGASVLTPKVTDQLPCSVCEPSDDKRDLGRKYCPHGVSPIEKKIVWSFLIHYNSLLQLDNHNNVLHATVSHLFRVTPKCRMEMKYELLFSVIYPTFIVSKHRYIIRLEESAYFLTVSCLNIFASLLNTVSFAEQFIQKGGLSYVLELVSLSEFSKQCCSILEIAIIVEIFKLMKDNSEMTYFREIDSLASVQMLFKSLAEMTDKCYKIYKLKLPEENFSELCDISREKEMLNFPFSRRASEPMQVRKMPQGKMIKTMFATSENVTEESIEDYLEVLKNIWTFWKSCASLCLYSPMFREYIVSESVFLDSYALLKVLLYYLCNCECGMAEMRLLIKIIESLLTVQFAAYDVTSGRSKEASGTLVRGALVAPAPLEAGGALRSLCEALIRVATAAPSRQHTMPRLGHAKIPPLLCPSGSSSAEGSSSEESVSGPYASEHSEPHTHQPDEGYEADVEVGKLDQLSSYKMRKLTASLTNLTMSGRQSPAGGGGAECGEYAGGGELAHPDLCLIVVDILTHLVHRLLSSQGEGHQGNMQRSGATLARACCARLAGALARARAAPPMLLQRLLSPTTAALLTHDNNRLADLQRSILELIHVLASQSIEPSELAAFLQLFKAERPPLAMLLTALQRLAAAAMHNTPDCILTFPVDSENTDNVQAMTEELSHIVLNSATSQSQQAEKTARKLHDSHIQAGVISPWSAGAVRVGIEGAGWAPWLQGFAARAWLRVAPSAPNSHTPPRPPSEGDRDNDWDTVDDWQDESRESSPRKKSPAREVPGPTELLHVLSLGHDSLMFEVWLDTDTGTFTFRLSRPETSSNKVLSETRVESGMTPHQWTCVAVNVKEVIHKRRTHIQVTLFVNGCECDTVSLPLQGILMRKVTPTNVLIGHACRRPARGGYHVSHVHVYRAPVLTVYSALHVTAHGPDHACQVRCESPNFPLLLTSNVLDCNIDWDQVYEMSGATLRELNDSLLLTFSAHAHTIMNLYHQTVGVALPTVFAGRVASSGLMSSTASLPSTTSSPHSSIPETLFTTWAGNPVLSRHRGITPALYLLGGPEVLLYLFARVVELGGSGVEQALALSILLRVCRADNRLHAMFYGDGQLDMLHTVLAAPRCRLDVHLLKEEGGRRAYNPPGGKWILSPMDIRGTCQLKSTMANVGTPLDALPAFADVGMDLEVLLDEACSSPVVSVSGSTVRVLARTDAVLLEPRLLVFIMRAWRHLETPQEVAWEVESPGGARHTSRGTLWALSLCAIRALIRDDHPRRAFNYYQMNRLDLLRHLLLACKERFLNSECGVLEGGASSSLVELVRGLMGAPPLLCHVALLCDLLLLMHQASDTFVTHSRANFYFLLTTETQDMSEYNINFMTKRKTPKRYKRRSDVDSQQRPKSTSAEDTVDENSVNLLKEMQSCQDENNPDSGVESTKEMKGIINSQIREKRKHNISSTSENSDLTAEDSGSGAGAGEVEGERGGVGARGEGYGIRAEEDALTGYIVVDVDDVNHTTVEMYTSGLYQQRRVRAGAAPGWAACEGLLLLLRDTVSVLPDHTLHQAVCGAIQAESLVVLGNHRDASVRAALVRVVAALQRRATPDLARKLKQHYYYLHLANQISLYPGSWELAAACASLLTKCDVPLEDQLDDDIWVDLTEDSIHRSPPLLALLASCLHDVPLAHNVTLIIRRIIDKASLKLINEVSIVEVVIRSIRAVALLGEEHFEGRELLLDDLHELLNRIAIKALSTQHNMQTISEIHYLLSYVETSSESGTLVRHLSRDAQVSLYSAQLDYLEERLHSSYTTHTNYANYFTTVLSSAVSLGTEGVSRAELASRHLATVSRAVRFLVAQPPRLPLHSELGLVDRLLATLLLAVSGTTGQRPKWWVSGSGAEWVPPLQELFWWAASPAPGTRALQPRLLRTLYLASPAAVHLLTPPDPPAMRKLAVYLLQILKNIHAEAEQGGATVELAITDWAREWAVSTQAGLAERLHSEALADEAAGLLRADEDRWARTVASHRHRAAFAKAVFSKDTLANKLTETAMGITRQVVDVQNGERKAFMEHLRRAQSEAVASAQRWQRLIDTYTHEQALWHDPASYPQWWLLDPTEAPGRIRVRLRRAHLNIHEKFLKPGFKHKAESGNRPSPLRSVVGGNRALRGGLVARLQLHETVAHMARVTHVTVAADTPGELLLSDRCIHFVPDDSDSDDRCRKADRFPCEHSAVSWPLEAVTCVATRRWCLQERAAELFLSSGHAHLLAFADINERTAFLKALSNCHLPNRMEPESLTDAMNQWRSGTITNWEYLMKLNGLGGRSYNDLMQYPVLPFVLADYTSRILDLNDPASFRDLSKPMAIQNKNREQHYINTYNDLKVARREGCSPLLSRQPHHYASLYSNSGGVLHYLVRLPPFTELFLNYQDNNFDMPDRTFHSLATTWRLITNDSPTDVKELIPELFYLPELFYNNEGLELGVRQCGADIDEVELPPWAADARLFTLLHRQALETRAVTERLPHWLDLVFGYKQTGQPAVDAINVFPACTYYGFDPCALEDEVDRTAAAAMVRTYGQAPRQLLRHAHPHAAAELGHQPHEQMSVWAGVVGARWGRYCGSPALGAPTVAARRQIPGACALHALPHPRAVAATSRATALLALSGEGPAPQSATQQGGVALMSWGHSDGVVRLKRRRDAAPDLLMHVSALDQVTCVCTLCTCPSCPVFAGHASGRVLAQRVRGPGTRARSRALLAHRAPLTHMHMCARAHLLVTASVDGLIVLWDLNKLTYIRTLPNRDMLSVTHVTISETLCDVASVHVTSARRDVSSRHGVDVTSRDVSSRRGVDVDTYETDAPDKYKSLIRVHTVNASFVGSVKVSERVTCVCYSNAPEGVSVNCIAAGLQNGGVKLYSSWDLRPVTYIPPANTGTAILSITYSSDSQLLFGCYADGVVVAWEGGAEAGGGAGAASRHAPVRIHPAHALL